MNKIESAFKEMMGTCSPSIIAYCMKDKALELERELSAVRAEIERLDTVGIHSCHDNCQRWPCVLRRELIAVTEQRDELLRYNEAFRKETLICTDCDSISKEEYDQAIEQRDRLAEAIRKHKASFPCAPDFCDVELYEALQSLTTNDL
jgi:hypothetical protein